MRTVRSGTSTGSALSRPPTAWAVSTMSGSGGWDCGWVSNGETNLPTACYETIEGIQGVTVNRIVLAGLAVFAVVGSGVATRTLSGQAQATQAQAAECQQNVLPVLAKSCLGCHNDKALAG